MLITVNTLIFLILYTYFLYPLIVIILSHLKKTKWKTDESNLPKVTIVFAAYNEESVIAEKLTNHMAIDYPPEKLEILAATDLSTDRTNDIIREFSNNEKNIIHVEGKKRQGKCQTINAAIHFATGNILVFTDANTLFDRGAIKALIKHFSDPKTGLVCGELKLTSPDENIGGKGESLYWKYETQIKRATGKMGALVGATGGIYAVKRELFEPFPTDRLIMDDFWLGVRIRQRGFRAIYDEKAQAFEKTSYSLGEEWERKVRIGMANFNVIPMLITALGPRNPFLAFQYFSHKILRWSVPFFILTIFVLSALGLRNPYLSGVFTLELLFLATALIGRKVKTLYPFTFFIVINTALFIGFLRAVSGLRSLSWSPAKRQ